ncbi:MAG: hypothetical protein J0M24_26730, partial [Verrucomicrobia bacterium]|nr:hypothetical protein [Verrucomicrobiota bacterium]
TELITLAQSSHCSGDFGPATLPNPHKTTPLILQLPPVAEVGLGPLRRGVFLLSLECNSYPRNADVGIRRLCDAVERLGPSERRLWERALSRTFDVGYSLAEGDKAVQVSLQPSTLSRVVAVGATVAFTCYRFPLPPVDPHP